MDIEKTLIEKLKRFEDIKNQLGEIAKQIGGLQEQQRAIYNGGLELKGQIDMLMELRAKEAADKPALILPDKNLVAADGKTVIAVPQESSAPAVEPEKPVEPVLEVK